jgi:YfiH family protein
METDTVTLDVTCPYMTDEPGIRHGFFTRQGGVSSGLFHSLNCGFGSGDDVSIVAENRRRVAESLGQEETSLCTAYQIHSPNTAILDHAWQWRDAPEADSLATNKPGIVLGILTADCVPVLFADSRNRVIGAAHAGWKGAIGGVLESTLSAMISLGANKNDIRASIGPAIGQRSYEVGTEFRKRFLMESPENTDFFIPSVRDGHFMFAIKAYVQNRLAKVGISQLHNLPYDTCAQEDLFFSYRRSCLNGEPVYGRQVSAIVLEP